MSRLSPSTTTGPSARFRAARALCSWLPPLLAQRLRKLIYPVSAARAEGHCFTVRSQTGSPFTGITSDFHGWPFAVQGYNNWRNVAIARAVCAKGDVIVEVGANIGTETVGFSDIVGASGVVYAFEPFPPNLDQLRRNAAQSRHGNITVFPLALSDHSTSAPFVVPPFGNSGRGHLLGLEKEKASEPPRDAVVEVRCTTLDSLLPQLRPPKLVVTDAEGHDAAILYGSEQLLAKHQPVIVLEARDRLLARAGTSSEELAKYLLDLDYGLFEIARFRLEPIDVDDGRVRRWTDWVAVPASNRDVVDRIRRILRKSGLMPCIARLNPLRREHDARAP